MALLGMGLTVFLAVMAADYCWARYTIHTAEKNAVRASLWSAGIVVLGSITTFAYLQAGWLMTIPAALGAFVGTLIAINSEK